MGKRERDNEIKDIIRDLEQSKLEIEQDSKEWFLKLEALLTDLNNLLAERDVRIDAIDEIDEIQNSVLSDLQNNYLESVIASLENIKDEIDDEIVDIESDTRREKVEEHYSSLDEVIEILSADTAESFDELLDRIDSCINELTILAGPYAK